MVLQFVGQRTVPCQGFAVISVSPKKKKKIDSAIGCADFFQDLLNILCRLRFQLWINITQ